MKTLPEKILSGSQILLKPKAARQSVYCSQHTEKTLFSFFDKLCLHFRRGNKTHSRTHDGSKSSGSKDNKSSGSKDNKENKLKPGTVWERIKFFLAAP